MLMSFVSSSNRGGAMEADKEEDGVDAETFQADKRKMIQPASLKDPKLDKLKEALLDWINSTLKAEHIVVRSLEEDLYDGLVLHHLLARLAGVHLSLEEIALTASAQIRKLEVVLEELDQRLGQQDTKWDVSLIHKKDLLATLHLLVAMVRRFQPEVELPTDVKVQVAVVEVSRRGIRSDVQTEVLTEASGANSEALSTTERDDPMEHLLKLEAHEVTAVKQAILHFVNKTMASVGLQVSDLDNQFSDGVILLLLIGQLEGFFIPLSDFSLIPVSHEEMLHNVSLALSLLRDLGLRVSTVEAHDVVSQDVAATLKVLYALFRKHGCS
ncbi:gamma-parvin isoform X3 [Dunckerocampus dactyliophorus]|uniref:gamma-parvin isoform X3 n=1 Tax=Dunckerocampus dactyliophorus TaxID=161453 RepID=UPI0024064501|nr:gamma-parvin isoform X3 [Dunckerocampus dactyliophorus]